ncbi:hypothetical protein ACFWNN_26600 [Lentzea sp. NPDC058450]|uniref:hypothetical protein n=1 Tax=Lentzea sp. NPDC058450 TaxID=3346505 RepID=UPI00364A1490
MTSVLRACAGVMLVSWAEMALRAGQIHLFHIPAGEARGLLGVVFPWLLSFEWTYLGLAVVACLLLSVP